MHGTAAASINCISPARFHLGIATGMAMRTMGHRQRRQMALRGGVRSSGDGAVLTRIFRPQAVSRYLAGYRKKLAFCTKHFPTAHPNKE
jgi:hypothetical protein